MSFFEKIQRLSKTKKKIILWSVVIIIGLSLFTFWVKNTQLKLKNFKSEEFFEELNLPSLERPLLEIPQLEIPEEQLNQENNGQ